MKVLAQLSYLALAVTQFIVNSVGVYVCVLLISHSM